VAPQLITSQRDGVIYVVLEYGDIDLARRLAQQEARRRGVPGALRPENFIRQTWEEMLEVRRCTWIDLMVLSHAAAWGAQLQ
jgi:hypothetical protein